MVNSVFRGPPSNAGGAGPVRLMGEILAARESAEARGERQISQPLSTSGSSGESDSDLKMASYFMQRVAEFANNVRLAGSELAEDLVDYGQTVTADIIVFLQSDGWGDPPLSLTAVNAIGTIFVIGSMITVQVVNPTIYLSVYGHAYLISKVIITVSNTFGVLTFAANQCVHMIYAPMNTTQEPRTVRLTMAVYACVLSTLPLMSLGLQYPAVRWVSYLNVVALNLCCHGLRQATLRLRTTILTNRTPSKHNRDYVNSFENLCEALTNQGKLSAWMVANQSSSTMCSSSLLWVFWWLAVMPYGPGFNPTA